jgi:predicted nucleotidyltransferase
MKGNRTKNLRSRVAREAALLLYTSQEKEYKQAKKRAAENLGTRILPSNLEVAGEVDRIAEEREGASREELLLRMRREARELMEILEDFNPRLVGSVWRGTARKSSDIDILTFSQDPILVSNQLQKTSCIDKKTEWCSVTKKGKKEASFHIHILLPSGDQAEVMVRDPDWLKQPERCETYGDVKTGLNLEQLIRILKENPVQKFIPT